MKQHRLLELAKYAGLKSQNEIGVSPAEEEFAKVLIQELCWDMINSSLDAAKVNRVAKNWGVELGVEE